MEGTGPRRYRKTMGTERFQAVTIAVGQTDLWIGMDPVSFQNLDIGRLRELTAGKIIQLQDTIHAYEKTHEGFTASLIPTAPDEHAPELIRSMITAGNRAGTGPMGAVAGTFAELIGTWLMREFSLREIVVENGGDIYLDSSSDLLLKVHAGSSPLSDKLGITIPAEISPLGVCTSAGTVGPSLSFGKADAVMIAHTSTAQADAYATAFCNEVHTAEDVDKVIEKIRNIDSVLSAVIIKDDKAGICGSCEVKVYR